MVMRVIAKLSWEMFILSMQVEVEDHIEDKVLQYY